MAEFYDHPETGKLHFRAPAGGHGGGATSMWDAPATHADIAAHRQGHEKYLLNKRLAAEKAAEDQSAQAETAQVVHQVEETVKAVNEVLAHQTVPHDGAE